MSATKTVGQLWQDDQGGSGRSNTQYDIAPTGDIYYMQTPAIPPPSNVRVILGWQALLKC